MRRCSHVAAGREHRSRGDNPPLCARGGREPDPIWAAVLVELGGADGITIHLREDRRHIQDRDLRLLRETVQVRLNLEMAVAPEIVELALLFRPDQVTLVRERREELTTEGGLDVAGQVDRVGDAARRIAGAGIQVSLFIDPDPRQVEASIAMGVAAVELHTGAYADAPEGPARHAELEAVRPRRGAALLLPPWLRRCMPDTGSITGTSVRSRGSTVWPSSISATASSVGPSSSD